MIIDENGNLLPEAAEGWSERFNSDFSGIDASETTDNPDFVDESDVPDDYVIYDPEDPERKNTTD